MDLYQQIFFTTLAIAFGLLHFILFLCNRHLKGNLYFAIFVFLYAASIFFDFQHFLVISEHKELFYLRIHRAIMPYPPIFALLFVYSLFESRIPKQFWFITGGLIVSGIFAIVEPVKNVNYIQIFHIAVLIEAIRLMIAGIRRKEDGAWIIVGGFAFLIVFSSYDPLMDFGVIEAINGIYNGYPFGFIGLIISMSVYLSRNFARTNKNLEAQLVQVKDLSEKTIRQERERARLEAENARKTHELEEARQLQVSMLPKELPQLAYLEIGVFMKTATEVGGDYYDFHLADNGTLTVAVGDATGHGMKAGTMVSVIKSLFIAEASQTDILTFFKKCTQTIK